MPFDEPYAMLPADGFKRSWIAAIDHDSYNYFPKEIPAESVGEAVSMGHLVHDSEADAQKECDLLNSM